MSKFKRAILIVLDGVGMDKIPDVAAYENEGTSSLVHCAQANGGLELPNLGRVFQQVLALQRG